MVSSENLEEIIDTEFGPSYKIDSVGREKRPGLPQVKVLCPLSGVMFGTMRIEAHYCNASRCTNGAVHIYCLLHLFKGFISSPQILEAWHVSETKEPSRTGT